MKSKHPTNVVTLIAMAALVFSTLMLSTLILSCAGGPEEIPEDMDPEELFQRGQEAVVDYEDYKTALHYYETFLERYPEDLQNRVIAQYEIAFIYYKMEKYDAAEERFNELLGEYQGEAVRVLPQWPKVLSEKLLARIAEIKAKRAGDGEEQESEQPEEQREEQSSGESTTSE